MQQIVVLLVLALVWAAVLIPQHVRNRAEARPADSIGAFQKQLSILERTSPAGATGQRLHAAPRLSSSSVKPSGLATGTRALIQKRRKDVLCALLAAMGGSLVIGFVPGLGVMHGLHLVLDLLFLAYVAMLVRLRNVADERESKVRYLPNAYLVSDVRPAPEPALLLRRSGS